MSSALTIVLGGAMLGLVGAAIASVIRALMQRGWSASYFAGAWAVSSAAGMVLLLFVVAA